MSDAPSIHDQVEDILNFIIHDLAYDADKLADNKIDPPKCENSLKPVKVEGWEAPGIYEEPFGKPGCDFRGNPSDQFNWCPFCVQVVWISPALPIGKKVECVWCHGIFRRSVA